MSPQGRHASFCTSSFSRKNCCDNEWYVEIQSISSEEAFYAVMTFSYNYCCMLQLRLSACRKKSIVSHFLDKAFFVYTVYGSRIIMKMSVFWLHLCHLPYITSHHITQWSLLSNRYERRYLWDQTRISQVLLEHLNLSFWFNPVWKKTVQSQ